MKEPEAPCESRPPWDWEREASLQMAAKLEAQTTLKLICEAINLDFSTLGNGWTEATPKILERIESIVDEAERAFTERDEWKARHDRMAGSQRMQGG